LETFVTPDFKKTSDVDVLEKFEKKHIPTIFEFIDIESELSDIIGRTVDLKTANDLSPYFRNEVLANAKHIYGKE
jgi:predicted nucleotidyltransferase